MRISLVTETYPPEINGVALTMQSLARGLASLGHEISLVRPRPAAESDADPLSELQVRGARLPRYPGLQFGLPMTGRVRRFWQAQRPDAVYIATEGPLGWAALRAAHRLGIPAATGFHTRFDEYFDHYRLRALSPLVLAFLRRFHNRAQATFVPTRELAGFLERHGFHGVGVLPRAVDLHRFGPAHRDLALRRQWGADDDTLVVLCVGRIAPEKNLALAVRAFEAIRARDPGTRFVWVGDGPSRAALQAAHPDFIFAGIQRGDALTRHYASADLFLFPSLSETFGNVTLEAMASGLPVVAFDYGAAREHIASPACGCAIARDDADGFVAAALRLAGDAAARRDMGLAARAALAGLDPGDVARRFADLLAALPRDSRQADA